MKLAALLAVAVLAVPVTARAHVGVGRMFETGHVSILSSRSPMFDLPNMVPGTRYTRSLSVGNNGTLAASWQLDAIGSGDTTLRVTVDELRRGGEHRRVFAGSLAALRHVDLGVVAPGDTRTYRFSVRPPRAAGRTGAARVDFRWTATGVYGVS